MAIGDAETDAGSFGIKRRRIGGTIRRVRGGSDLRLRLSVMWYAWLTTPRCRWACLAMVVMAIDAYRPLAVAAFNVDTSMPVVKLGPVRSYFGFSVAQHSVFDLHHNRSNPMLLIGAPRDNVSSSSSEGPPVVRPGAVYRCPMTSEQNDCVQLIIDSEVRPGEDKTDQWMGVSVVSQGTPHGRALACAHRRTKRGPSFEYGLGLCVSLTNALDEDWFWEPCEGRPVSGGHNELGYCQAGTSATMAADGTVLFGAPGSYNWRGSLFTLGESFSWHQSPVEDSSPSQPRPDPATSYYAYLGMSVKMGFILDGRKTIIAGAPRSKYAGQVLLFEPTDDGMTISPDHYLSGEQFGSGFGYDIAVVDINGDGHQDLAVSAPFYHEPQVSGAVYIYINGPQGINSRTIPVRILSRKIRDADCDELNCHAAWFGFALSAAGDLDQDGYQDLIVGAPFEGSGAIYIFRGSAAGVSHEYSQRIAATDLQPTGASLPRPLTSFGYSLTSGMDVDGNGYPDLVVGAFQSDAVVILRTRPVVNIITQLHTHPSPVDPSKTQCTRDGLPYNCFKLRACLRFTVNPANKYNRPMDVNLTLESEKFAGIGVSRAFFLSDGKETHVHTETVTMHRQLDPRFKCTEIQAYIIRSNRDFLNPIRFQLSYKLARIQPPSLRPGEQLADLSLYPVINESLARIHHNVEFMKNCGVDSRCDSNLMVRGVPRLVSDETGRYVLKVGHDRELQLLVRIKNTGEDAHETVVTLVLPSFLEYRGVDGPYSCTLNDDETVTCDVGNPFPANQEASFNIRVNIDKLESSTREMELILHVNTTSNETDDLDNSDFIKIKVVIETDLSIKGFSVPGHVFYGGTVVGESAMTSLEDIGPEVTHGYEVTNNGLGTVRNTRVTINWPYEVRSLHPVGKHLLYLTELPQVKSSGRCNVTAGRINPLRLPSSQWGQSYDVIQTADNIVPLVDESLLVELSDSSRLRREAPDTLSILEAASMSNSDRPIRTLDCSSGSARCCSIECTIDILQPGGSTVITVKSRLWNGTFVEDFSSARFVNILSNAKLSIDSALNIRQLSRNNDVDKAITKAFPDVQVQRPPGVPLWAIILSICLGVLFLVVIILFLWKCGFFRRRQKDDGLFYTATVVRQKNYLFED